MNLHDNKNIMNALIEQVEHNKILVNTLNRYYLITSFYSLAFRPICLFLLSLYFYFSIMDRIYTEGQNTILLGFLIIGMPINLLCLNFIFIEQIPYFKMKYQNLVCQLLDNVIANNNIDFSEMKAKMENYEFMYLCDIIFNKKVDSLFIIESIRKYKSLDLKCERRKKILHKKSQKILKKMIFPTISLPVYNGNKQDKRKIKVLYFSKSIFLHDSWLLLLLPIEISLCFVIPFNTPDMVQSELISTISKYPYDHHDKTNAIIKYNSINRNTNRINIATNKKIEITYSQSYFWNAGMNLFIENSAKIDSISLNNHLIDNNKNAVFYKIIHSEERQSEKNDELNEYLKQIEYEKNNRLIINYH